MIASSVASMTASKIASMTRSPRDADLVAGRAEDVVVGRQPVAGRERDEQVPAGVTAGATRPRDAQPCPLGDPLALVGEERGVGRGHHDDRSRARLRRPGQCLGGTPRALDLVVADLRADRDAVDAQPAALPVVGLDQDADRVAATFRREDA